MYIYSFSGFFKHFKIMYQAFYIVLFLAVYSSAIPASKDVVKEEPPANSSVVELFTKNT